MPVRAAKDLTSVRVRTAKPKAKQYEIFDRSVGGFALRVSPTGLKSFVVNYRFNGKSRRYTLGSTTATSLSDARNEAIRIKNAAKDGIDPQKEKQRQEEAQQLAKIKEASSDANTFAAVADLFIKRHAVGRGKTPRLKSWKQYDRNLKNHVLPKWGTRQIDEIKRKDVVALLDYVEDNSGLVAANRTLATVRKLFNWAMLRSLVEFSPIITGMARPGEKPRDRTLNDAEIKSLWMAAEKFGYPFGHYHRVLLATGQRKGEIANMCWSDLDIDKAVWTIPSYKTKSDRGDHVVPLNETALRVIKDIPHAEYSAFVFPARGNFSNPLSGFSKVKPRLDKMTTSDEFKKAGLVALSGWTLHDLRRTMATTMGQELQIPPHIIGACLNHSPKASMGVTSVYVRGVPTTQIREAMDAWSEKLESILNPEPSDNVVSIKRAKRAKK